MVDSSQCSEAGNTECFSVLHPLGPISPPLASFCQQPSPGGRLRILWHAPGLENSDLRGLFLHWVAGVQRSLSQSRAHPPSEPRELTSQEEGLTGAGSAPQHGEDFRRSAPDALPALDRER